MSRRIVLHKATRIEGNASIQIELEAGRVRTARFVVPDFRGFETIVKGCPVEQAPGMISRVCGLCSASHQVTSVEALERALGIEPPEALRVLRHVVVLGEWIGSHAFAYFFLATPDMVDAPGGIFELARTHPQLVQEAFALREAGQRVVRALGKRASHPVALGIGRFLVPPSQEDLEEVREAALDVRARSRRLIAARAADGTQRVPEVPDCGLIGFAIALVLAEVLVRIFFDEAVQPRYVVDPGYGVRWNKANVDTRHYVPGDYEVRIRTNSVGMRGTREYPVERVPGKRRILVLGDSFTFGYGVNDDEVVSAVLEDLLNERESASAEVLKS